MPVNEIHRSQVTKREHGKIVSVRFGLSPALLETTYSVAECNAAAAQLFCLDPTRVEMLILHSFKR